MNLKSFFPALLLTASLVLNPGTKNSVTATEKISVVTEGFNYVYEYVDGVLWVFVYDEKGNFVEAYPIE